MSNLGIGYLDYKTMRINEGLKASKIESPGNERFIVYFGRSHVHDHETGVLCRGHMKVGRGKFATALMRGRNQPGIDFRIYVEIVLANNNDTHLVERIAQGILSERHLTFSQGQQEMYNVSDNELLDFVNKVVLKAGDYSVNILSVATYV